MTHAWAPLFRADGARLALGEQLAVGGEGVVFAVDTAEVAKLYHQPPTAQKVAKLKAMAQASTPRLLRMTAWPTDVIVDNNGAVVGFIMPRVARRSDLHVLYGPKTRLAQYPTATVPFLVHVAANVARAFAVVHDHGHVVGDVNQGGVAVADDGTVALVDCDSFQIASNGHTYACDVGVPHYQPPELQGVPTYRGLARAVEHDRFGLAVLLFQTLFLGRHPFAGDFGGREFSLEEAIAARAFVYGRGAAAQGMAPPRGSLPLTTVSDELAALFERAFVGAAAERPTARDFIAACEGFRAQLRPCASNAAHAHAPIVAACPLCALENRTRLLLFFPPEFSDNTAPALDPAPLLAEFDKLAAVRVPAREMFMRGAAPLFDSVVVDDEGAHQQALRTQIVTLGELLTAAQDACANHPVHRETWGTVRTIGGVIAGGMAATTAALAAFVGPVALASAAVAAVAAGVVVATRPPPEAKLIAARDELALAHNTAISLLTASKERVAASAAAAEQRARLRTRGLVLLDELDALRTSTARDALLRLAESAATRVRATLPASREAVFARQEYLADISLADFQPPLPPRVLAMLAGAGIGSAADVTDVALAPLVSQRTRAALVQWRKGLEARFVATRDPNAARAHAGARIAASRRARSAVDKLEATLVPLRRESRVLAAALKERVDELSRLRDAARALAAPP